MSRSDLEPLLAPGSLAVIGATDRSGSVGSQVVRNVLAGGFAGPVWLVNPHHGEIAGHTVYASPAALPAAPDLAIVATPAASVPGVIDALGRRGARAAVVLSAGVDATPGPGGLTLCEAMLRAARTHRMRLLGPNCVGLLVPRLGLNASFAHAPARPGPLAFVSQSGALTTALLDWALAHPQIGFSQFVSLGNGADVEFGDLLDYLATDRHTRAILLYIESITGARRFMSAARAAARAKPVIAVKAGRVAEGAKAAASHTGALAGADDVYEAALQRAGILRVGSTRELFEAAETLASIPRLRGGRLAIVSNGGGPAVMATDALIGGGGELARLAPETVAALDVCLPRTWSHGNPVDLVGDAAVERYLQALRVLARDPGIDALLLIHAPTAIASPSDIARACIPALRALGCPALTCWMGSAAVADARAQCEAAGLAAYSMPEEAIGAFLHLERHRRSRVQLLEAPPAFTAATRADRSAVRALLAALAAQGRDLLTEPESKQVLAEYGIPVVETRTVADADGLPAAARALGFPLALKILSPDISHKSDVGGVVLDIGSLEELTAAARAMRVRCAERVPQARITGFTLQRMVRRGGACELLVGMATDPTFGPVILFGQGGTAAELIADRAIALPPLNRKLARELIGRTRIARLLAGYRERAAVDAAALEGVLVCLSELVADIPEIAELDINPLLADARGVVALDARIRIAAAQSQGSERFAIRPYPRELEELRELAGRSILLRPIRPEDHDQHAAFLARIEPEDLRARFFHTIRELSAEELARFTQLDYEREMAFIAVSTGEGTPETLGVARASTDADNLSAEFAVLVRSDMKGHGLGALLLEKLIAYVSARGTQRLVGEVLAGNARMLHLAEALGFERSFARDGVIELALELPVRRTGAVEPRKRTTPSAGP